MAPNNYGCTATGLYTTPTITTTRSCTTSSAPYTIKYIGSGTAQLTPAVALQKYNYWPNSSGGYTLADCDEEWCGGMMSRKLVPGTTYDLPDGSKIILDVDGNYRVDDKDSVVRYKANPVRDFSPHMNASDMLSDFVRYVRGLGVPQEEVLGLPLQLFVSWLIIEAAERDGDPVPEGVVPVGQDAALREHVKPKCLQCGRFIKRLHQKHRFPFCSPQHGARYSQLRLAC